MIFGNPKSPSESAFFLWNEAEHSVGVPQFDAEHRHLADLLTHVHTILVKERDRSQASKLMARLIHETREHFHREELALREAGFGDFEAHAAEHSALLAEADELVKRFNNGSVSALALPTFLKNWLIGHLKGSDRKYAACLRRHMPIR